MRHNGPEQDMTTTTGRRGLAQRIARTGTDAQRTQRAIDQAKAKGDWVHAEAITASFWARHPGGYVPAPQATRDEVMDGAAALAKVALGERMGRA